MSTQLIPHSSAQKHGGSVPSICEVFQNLEHFHNREDVNKIIPFATRLNWELKTVQMPARTDRRKIVQLPERFGLKKLPEKIVCNFGWSGWGVVVLTSLPFVVTNKLKG